MPVIHQHKGHVGTMADHLEELERNRPQKPQVDNLVFAAQQLKGLIGERVADTGNRLGLFDDVDRLFAKIRAGTLHAQKPVSEPVR